MSDWFHCFFTVSKKNKENEDPYVFYNIIMDPRLEDGLKLEINTKATKRSISKSLQTTKVLFEKEVDSIDTEAKELVRKGRIDEGGFILEYAIYK